MNAMDRGRMSWKWTFALAVSGSLGLGTSFAWALQRPGATKPTAKSGATSKANEDDTPLKAIVHRVPVNPEDPIALVNGEKISRRELADECVAQNGEKVLDALINRRLIEQEVRAKRLSITASEIDAEIERVAQSMAHVDRETWLKTLAKERGISPSQYARDMIYPSLALRKLAAPQVVVTETDLKEGFEAAYGDRIRCRMIMVKNQTAAKQICEMLKAKPGDFEKIAKEKSIDQATRTMGGLIPDAITRHAEPRQVSDKIFEQLVRRRSRRRPRHKPKDGTFTGPIQVAPEAWVIVMREEWLPAKDVDFKEKKVRAVLTEQIREGKISEKMDEIFHGMKDRAMIDNLLTGQVNIVDKSKTPRDGKAQAGTADDNPTANGRNTVSTLKGNQPRVKTPPAPRMARPDSSTTTRE